MKIMLAKSNFCVSYYPFMGDSRNGMYLINNAIDLGCLRDPS
jgi:hypothetical protein